jgi:hypothetical protein
MPTTTTRLTRPGRVDGYEGSTGAFCLVREHRPKSRPGCVTDRLSQTMIMHHSVDFQILYRYQPEAVDYPTAVLVREIVSTTTSSLVHSCNYFPTLHPLRRAFFLLREKTLGLSQRAFLRPKEARVLNLLSSGESGERLQSNVNAYLLAGRWQRRRLPLARKGGVPLARRGASDTQSLGHTLKRAVEHHLDGSDFGQVKGITHQLTAGWGLWVAKAIVALLPPKPGVAWSFPRLHPAKERLESKVYPHSNILQHLAVNLPQRRAFLLDSRQQSVLVIQGKRLAALLVGILVLGKQVVVEPATLFKHFTHLSSLLASGIYAIEECLTHFLSIVQKRTFSNLEADFRNLLRTCGLIPLAKARGLARWES